MLEVVLYSGAKIGLVVLLAVLVVAVGVRWTRSSRFAAQLATARADLGELRIAADSCSSAIVRDRDEFAAYNARVDSLRERVRSYEASDPRGVAQDSYAVYLGAFTAYNDSAGAWAGRADTLRAEVARCQQLSRQHNAMMDSVRRMIMSRQPSRR